MKIFLTGGTGFIGSNFLNTIHRIDDIQVIAVKRHETSKPRIKLIKEPEWIISSLGDIEINVLKKCDILVHLAAHSSNSPYDNIENCIKYNVTDSLSLVKKSLKAGIKKFIIAGTCFEYGKSSNDYDYIPVNAPLNPVGSYPVSKAMFYHAVMETLNSCNVDYIYCRFFQVYGLGEDSKRLYPSLIRAAKNNEDFIMSSGTQERDFIEVRELVSELINLCQLIYNEKKEVKKIINIGKGVGVKVKDFALDLWLKNKANGKLILKGKPLKSTDFKRIVAKI